MTQTTGPRVTPRLLPYAIAAEPSAPWESYIQGNAGYVGGWTNLARRFPTASSLRNDDRVVHRRESAPHR